MTRLADKLNPGKVRVSPMFHAILACLLGQTGWSRPQLVAVTVTATAGSIESRRIRTARTR